MQSATSEVVDAIKNIGGTIGAMNEIATTIAASVVEQGSATQEIARNVQATASGTNQMSNSISRVTRATSEAGTAAGQVVILADKLGAQAENLRANSRVSLPASVRPDWLCTATDTSSRSANSSIRYGRPKGGSRVGRGSGPARSAFQHASYAREVKGACVARVGLLGPFRVNQRGRIGLQGRQFSSLRRPLGMPDL